VGRVREAAAEVRLSIHESAFSSHRFAGSRGKRLAREHAHPVPAAPLDR